MGLDLPTLTHAISSHPRVDDISLTAEHWDLYTDKPGAETAAQALNNAFKQAVNQKLSAPEVAKVMDSVMFEHADLGAADTEPREVLNRLLANLYGESARGLV